MGWILPTGHDDTGGDWSDELKAYDDDLVTYAVNGGTTWATGFLDFTHAAIECSKVRVYADRSHAVVDQVRIRAYWGGAWHYFNFEAWTPNTWKELDLGGTYSVTAIGVSFNHSEAGTHYAYLKEFNFWEVEVPPPVGRSFGFIFG